ARRNIRLRRNAPPTRCWSVANWRRRLLCGCRAGTTALSKLWKRRGKMAKIESGSKMENKMNLLITGGAGFIGSNLIHHVIHRPEVAKLVNLDCLTYAGHLVNLEGVDQHPNYVFEN